MNLNAEKEEQTKTIKYLNKSDYDVHSSSSSQTEKQYQQELLLAGKIFRTSKNNSKQLVEAQKNCKIVVIETLEKYGAQRSQGHHHSQQPNKTRHKKGKSMDLEELLTNQRENPKPYSVADGSKEKRRQKDTPIQYKERKSISQMKQYASVSKKFGSRKDVENGKKRKEKTNHSHDMKYLRKQMKKIIEETPIFTKPKRKQSTQRSVRNQPINQNSKNLKHYSKSEELFAQPKEVKGKKKLKNKTEDRNRQEFKQISFSMPMTSKIIHLFSNNSSVYNSQKDLGTIQHGRSYVIPTEQSCEQISEIREYQHTVLKKQKSSQSLRLIRKATPINRLIEEQIDSRLESTENIIQHYISKYQEYERQPEITELSNINKITDSIAEPMAGSLSIGQMHGIPSSQSIRLDESQVLNGNNSIRKHEEGINQLDELIIEIEKKGDRIHKNQKDVIFEKIKGIIQKSSNTSPSKPQKVVQVKKEEPEPQKIEDVDKSNNELTNSDLKESFNFQQKMSQLNLQLLDKALRQRQAYLTQRRQKELLKLEQAFDQNDQINLEEEKQKISKWIDHEIKSVVHTRHQLWKGFNIAKNILEDSQATVGNHKKGDMMKCLSDKYLNRIKSKKNKKNDAVKKQEKRKDAELSQKDSDSVLGHGRVASLQSQESKQELIQSDVACELPSDEQMLISQTKIKTKEEEKKKEKEEESSSIDEDYQYDRNNVLNKPIGFGSDENKVNVAESMGLNIKPVQCDDIDYQDSYNEEDLQALAKESQKVKEESMKMPFNLTIDDKEDIYQFIFLDLCVELTDQYSVNSKVIKKIFNFIKTMNEQSKKQKGFKTNTTAIKDYLFQFVSFLKNEQPFLDEVYTNLDKPLGPTALDILKYMHPNDEEPFEEESNETVFILDIKLFQQFQNQFLPKIQFEKYYEDEDKEKKRRAFLKNAIHIHNKAIFDALNQTLDKVRPYGVWGEPFSWKKIAKFYHDRDTNTKNNTLLKSAQKTIEYGAFMCGFMIDKQDCNLRGNPNISQSYIDQIRDDRLSRMLANDLQEGEEKMLFIDDEQTEILVEVSHLIYQSLLQETLKDLSVFL